ncbi:CD48 antigen [Stegastes partitus]|uniref:CD48 antigen n=1 Tax=Stegastes partitus TaxID=144197 RepID=A0A3B5AHA3_9TELE|nr:PREDICTED: CD48 antigen [Stegastes partitus]
MKQLTLLILFLQVVLVKSLGEVSGYLGDSITLRSGVDPSWSLSKIEWSIFSNHTWIATYHKGRKSTERVPRYKGRLSLNISSGDLTIERLTKKDAMEYTVDIFNTEDEEYFLQIKLIVRERLQIPVIRSETSSPVQGQCFTVLDCSSPENGVHYSWHVVPSTVYITGRSSPHLLAIFNTTDNPVSFTCTTSNNMDNASSVVTLKCDGDKLQPVTPEPAQLQGRERFITPFLIGLLVGAITVTITVCFRVRIGNAFQCLTEKLCSSKK